MRRFPVARSVLTAAMAVGVVASSGAPAGAADACPNAAFRSGAEARLPDCRAWEQVTPTAKNGVDVVNSGTVASVAGGDRVYFNAAGAFSGAESVLYDTAFLSARGADWSTRGTDPPLTPTGLLVKATLGLSQDGTKAVVTTSLALAPGAIAGGSNVYVRDLAPGGGYRLVAAAPGGQLYQDLTGFGGQGNYIGGSDDLSSIAFQSTSPLTPDAPDDGRRVLYVWRDGELEIAGRLPDGTIADLAYDGNTPSRTQRRVSADGSRVLFRSGYGGPLYQWVAGHGTTLISRSRRTGEDPPREDDVASFRASDDGRTVTFQGQYPLTDDSVTPESGVPGALYRWTADDDRLTDLTAPFTPEDSGPLALSLVGSPGDGRWVWFTSNRPLTADAGTSIVDRLYVLDTETETLRLVTAFPDEIGGPGQYRLSPSGNRIAFQSFSAIAGAVSPAPSCREAAVQPGLCGNVFTYGVDTPSEPLRCASCGPAGSALQAAAASFGRPATAFDGRDNRAVLDDGRVYFDTPNRLAADDTNDVGDVYEWAPGRGATLVSSGSSGESASFGDVSPGGRDVFFVTADRLVAQDADSLADLYTARVGGGIASQRTAPPSAAGGCTGESCRPAPAPAPGRPEPGSATFEEPVKGASPRLTVTRPTASALRTAGRRGRLTVRVDVTAAGTISANLRGRFPGRTMRRAASTSVKAKKAGKVQLTLKLSASARKALRRKGRLSLRLTVAYPAASSEYQRTLTLTTGRKATSTKGGAR